MHYDVTVYTASDLRPAKEIVYDHHIEVVGHHTEL